ncbi:MAG: hypothetical protein RSA01_08400 [Clostridium sp.]|uniref:hypothetical protein n=1 Tax=Clostridium sp. TaxID=1506 RepID=UPI002FC6F6EB
MFSFSSIGNKSFEDYIVSNKVNLYKAIYIYTREEKVSLNILKITIEEACKNLRKFKNKPQLKVFLINLIREKSIAELKKTELIDDIDLKDSLVNQLIEMYWEGDSNE